MTDLSKMDMEELAFLYRSISGDRQGELDAIFEEIQRRQRMLEAAEGMAEVLKLYEWSAGNDDCSFGFCPACGVPEFKPHGESCDMANALTAYTAAKETP